MAVVIGIKFKTSSKVYWFDPNGETFQDGDHAILETQRGLEYGKVVFGNKEVDDKQVTNPLKPVIRRATPQDDEQHRKNMLERERLMHVTLGKVAAHNLPMKVVDAEYTFDRSKIIVYFTAENRVDFRELVKDLASVFHLRIELRQIYERDDIKLRGALAVCGRPCCCSTHLADYEKVSIKMAKVQGLSLNPQKISGCCGKLMCCLRYENDYYQDVYKKMPRIKATVDTPDGTGIVEGTDFMKQEVRVRRETKDGGIEVKNYPLDKVSKHGAPNQPQKGEKNYDSPDTPDTDEEFDETEE